MKHHILVKILYNTPGWTSLGSKFMYTTNKKENYNVFSYTKRDSVFTLLFKDGTEKSVHFPLRCELHGIVSCCMGRSRVEAWIMNT